MKKIIVTEELAIPGVKVEIRDTSRHKHQGMGKDGNKMIGEILRSSGSAKWVKVRWSDDSQNSYRVGADGEHDLHLHFPEGIERMLQEKPEPAPTVQEMRDALSESIKYVKEDPSDREFYEKRGYDIYGKSLKPNTNGTTSTEYRGNVLYVPPKNLTLKRGERPEGHRLKG